MNAPAITKRTGPSIARGSSKQDYETPPALLRAVEARFGKIAWDLAATDENAKAQRYYTPAQDSLKSNWSEISGVAWCNPPFDPIAPWLEKAASVRDRAGWTIVLAPAAVGAEWYAAHVEGKAVVVPLRPRVPFVGMKHGYPRDLALYLYGFGMSGVLPGWRWLPAKPRKGRR
jgi:phage N-6-adenine-methyltransferase